MAQLSPAELYMQSAYEVPDGDRIWSLNRYIIYMHARWSHVTQMHLQRFFVPFVTRLLLEKLSCRHQRVAYQVSLVILENDQASQKLGFGDHLKYKRLILHIRHS